MATLLTGSEMGAEPWLPYLATEFLASILQPDWSVFEWGSGAGRAWLAQRCSSVVSVEQDPAWVKQYQPWVTLLFIPPEQGEIGADPSEPANYRSNSPTLGPGRNWKKYVQAIDAYGLFDLVLIDGWARPSCIVHAIPHVADSQIVIQGQ